MGLILKNLSVTMTLLILTLPVAGVLAQEEGSGVKGYGNQYKSPYPYPERRFEKAVKRTAPRRVPSETVLLRRLTAKSVIVMDGRTGETIYAYCANLPRQPASTIKILTGLISMKALEEEAMVCASRRASRMPRSKIYLRRGKSYQADDLINAVLLASANDASVALAEKISGSEKAFAKLMTRKAREMGAKFTVCKTATGLTRRGQKSTVRDLAVIFNKAMKNLRFARKMAKKSIKTTYGKILKNHNKALWNVEGALGGKTGYTRAAGQTYVGKFRRGKNELVVAIMGSKSRWRDVRKLVEYGFAKKMNEDRIPPQAGDVQSHYKGEASKENM